MRKAHNLAAIHEIQVSISISIPTEYNKILMKYLTIQMQINTSILNCRHTAVAAISATI